MEIKSLTAGLSVSEQIKPTDIQEIKDAGFRAIICNRPDGEGVDQPTFEEIAKAAKKLGIKTSYLPIVSGKVSDDDAAALERELTKLPGPILAFCRTGTRSATLWSLAQVKHRSVADILAATKAAGYDMGVVMRRIVNGDKTLTAGIKQFADIGGAHGQGRYRAKAHIFYRRPIDTEFPARRTAGC